MEDRKQMMRVTVGSETRLYPAGITYGAIAADYRDRAGGEIVLVSRDGKLRELHRTLRRDCTLEMLTTASRPGYQTLERSVILLFLKAFYDVVGPEHIRRVNVDHSVSCSLFIRADCEEQVDEALLARVEARMKELTAAALPIIKHSMDTDDAVALFRAGGMPDKADTLLYRLGSRVNVYELDGFCDYFYGYMVPNTSYLHCYALLPAGEGSLYLRLPDPKDPDKLGPFRPSVLVSRAQLEATLLTERMGIPNVGALNNLITADRAVEVILSQEAMMEKRIGDIAQHIADRPDVRLVLAAGPSSSGKTTFSHRLATQLRALGLTPHTIAADNYFLDREKTPRDENGQYDFECLEAMDIEAFTGDMLRLLAGEAVEMPRFNFKTGRREYTGHTLTLGERDILIVEGIHCLNDRFSGTLPRDRMYRVYISCLTCLNIDDHNRIPTTDVRLLRRISRDARTRGNPAADTIAMWPSVRRGEETHIFPYQDSADEIFNSSLLYEICLLRPYVEPLLYGIPRGNASYAEAKRLLKFLSYFLPVPPDTVPLSSILREFIGGGCYNV